MKGRRIRYSAEQLAWLETNRTLVISDYHAAFCAEFDRKDVTAAHLHGLRKRKGWKVGRAKGRYKGRQEGRYRLYSAEEAKWLRENCTLEISEYHRKFCAKFNRTDRSPDQLHSLRHRKGWRTGRTGCFKKGQEPPNKGKRCPEGTGGRHPNARQTQFKKGGLPHNTRGAGHERIDNKDGYVVMIVAETNPWTGAKTRPVLKHRYLWEKANGSIPEGHALKCKDGDKTNCNPSNWELIPRAILPRLNGGRFKTHIAFDDAPAELKPTVLATAKLAHRAKEARRAPKKKIGAHP
jgi:hypothetical protein